MPEILRAWRQRRRARNDTTAARPLLERGSIPWLLLVAAATTLPHSENLPWWLSLFCALALLARTWLWWRNGRLPGRWLLALTVVIGTLAIAWNYRTLFGRDAGIALLVFFMALKPMEMSARRDGVVLVMLGFFLLLTHYFYVEDVVTGLWLFLAAAFLAAALLRIHGGAQPIAAIARQSGMLVAQALPLMIVLFLLFPRIEGPLWGLPRDAYSGQTGLSDQMSPGSLDQLIQSGDIAFRARFATAVPPRAKLYWRGPVFDSYDGRTWRASAAASVAGGHDRIEAAPTSNPVDYEITLEAHNSRWLLALDMPVALPKGSAIAPTLEVRSRLPVRVRNRFTFSSVLDYVANREENPRLLQTALRLPPELNPRTRELAARWQRELATPEAISQAALRFFREERFFYTLQPPLLGQNAVDEFLFDSRRGFCEHYAGAYVVLMRAAGIPARVVAGYQGGEVNPIDGYLTVRQSDAHAWAEIWIAERGWIRVDPTAAVAPSRIERGIGAALPAGDPLPALVRLDSDWLYQINRLRYRWEAVNNTWNQWILGYNPERQREVLMRLGMAEPQWQTMATAMAAAGAVVFLLLSFWSLARRPPRVTPEVRAWQAFCKELARHGLRRQAWQGPFDLARRAARESPELAALVQRAAGLYAGMRYGRAGNGQLAALRQCRRELIRRKKSRRNST